MSVAGGPALPVVISTDNAQGGPAYPVYGYTSADIGSRLVDGGPAIPVKVLTVADLVQNGGKYYLSGEPEYLPVYEVAAGSRSQVGGPAIPVYVMGGSIGAVPAPPAPPTGIYYVDATNGDDTKDGLSQANAWKTVTKVNASAFQPDNQILFKCGEVFKGVTLLVPSSGTAGHPITFGKYGAGANPIIDPTIRDTSFTLDSGAIWKHSIANVTNLLQVFQDGTRLIYKANKASMVAGSVAYVAGAPGTLYVWCTDSGDPNTGHVIEYQTPVDGLESAIDHNGKSYLVFDGIDTKRANKHGYRLWNDTSPGTTVTVQNCTSSFNGAHGFYSYKCAYSLFSHCVAHDNMDTGCWIGSADGQIIEYCESYNQGLDVAPHGKLYPAASHWPDGMLVHGAGTTGAIVRYNNIHDFWAPSGVGECLMIEGPAPNQSGTLVYGNIIDGTVGQTRAIGLAAAPASVTIKNNIIRHAGATDGYGIYVVNCTDLKIYHNTIIAASGALHCLHFIAGTTITVRNNIFVRDGATNRYMTTFAVCTGVSYNYNLYYQISGTPRWHWGPAAEYTTFVTWQGNANSPDANSPTPASPVFVTAYTDLHIQTTSPAKNAGVAGLGVSDDYDGNPRPFPATLPDIGAYEFQGA